MTLYKKKPIFFQASIIAIATISITHKHPVTIDIGTAASGKRLPQNSLGKKDITLVTIPTNIDRHSHVVTQPCLFLRGSSFNLTLSCESPTFCGVTLLKLFCDQPQ